MQKKKSSIWGVLIAIVLAIIIGTLTGPHAEILGISLYSIYDLGGKIFINSLSLIVVPFVSSSIITGIARISNEGSLGRLGAKVFAFYIGTSLLAILIGLFFVNLLEPGVSFSLPSANLTEIANASQIKEQITSNEHRIGDLILQIFPSNIVDIFHGQMLGLISFSIVFGYAISKIDPHPSSVLMGFWQGVFQAMLRITQLIMKFLPIGVFCLVAKTFAKTGLESLQSCSSVCFNSSAGIIRLHIYCPSPLIEVHGEVNPYVIFKRWVLPWSLLFLQVPLQQHCQLQWIVSKNGLGFLTGFAAWLFPLVLRSICRGLLSMNVWRHYS